MGLSETTPGQTGSPPAEAVTGRATGALFFVGFGTVWMFFGLRQMHRASWPAVAMLLTACLALLALTSLLMRQARSLPSGRYSPEEQARTRRMFNAVNIIQWVSVATAVIILNVLHLTAYIVPAIAVIVGLHLFPLAQAFRYPQHYVTGSCLVLWPMGCLVTLPQEKVSGVCAVGTGVILLLSAAATLLRTFVSTRGRPAAVSA